MSDGVLARGFPAAAIRARARLGAQAAFPPDSSYGREVFGGAQVDSADVIESARLVPPVFMPQRLARLVELGAEPTFEDVELATEIGGFRSALPVYLSAFGSTELGSAGLGTAAGVQAARLGIPMVIGENVVPMNGRGGGHAALLERIQSYAAAVPPGTGGVVVQQSTEDADAEVWNLVYSDPTVEPLLATGRLGFELKVGQGAKPGLGGMTLLPAVVAERVRDRFGVRDVSAGGEPVLVRSSTPGTFIEEILRQQVRLMRNNFPRARTWVKLPPARDVAVAARTAWAAGADAVTVDGAEGGTGWAPTAFLNHVGLPLGECLLRIGGTADCLLASGGVWEGSRVVKCLALGARAVGLGRAALLAVAEDREHGLVRLAEALALETRMLISALGKYTTGAPDRADLWFPADVSRRRDALRPCAQPPTGGRSAE